MNKSNQDNLQSQVLIETDENCRQEILNRIQQRDQFSIQFITTVCAIVGVAMLDFQYASYLFLLLPLVTMYYSLQILYSYEIHDRIHKFLTDEVEPELGKLCGYNQYEIQKHLWETYCKVDDEKGVRRNPGIRKNFFKFVPFVMDVVSPALFYIVSVYRHLFDANSGNAYVFDSLPLLVIASVSLFVFIVAQLFVTFFRPSRLNKLSPVDYKDESIIAGLKKKGKFVKTSKAVFLDKDGTIYKDKVMTHKKEDLEYFPDTFDSIKSLYDKGYLIIICTNQNGIRKGVYTEHDMHEFHKQIIEDSASHGIKIAAIYYSPYDEDDKNVSYKPDFGMFIRAQDEFNIDVSKSFSIGDQITDVMASMKAFITPIMVTTGIYPNNDFKNDVYEEIKPLTVNSLKEAKDIICSR
jgi:D-glycero-D-manno-heptose 1,7-bisphosphate phosphatase